ncbi:hypothetical protein DPEC_G00024100 [Dallia pectoralis]|uniref:Uncharacterized protein n=1 Tax=Dallia pectoralis TaxID=75939 RepID=A0ACC2HH05_DALPE|nr:hypothetical protein DPEC_G00024100 [Dallia pectoralis]
MVKVRIGSTRLEMISMRYQNPCVDGPGESRRIAEQAARDLKIRGCMHRAVGLSGAHTKERFINTWGAAELTESQGDFDTLIMGAPEPQVPQVALRLSPTPVILRAPQRLGRVAFGSTPSTC